MTIPDPQLRGLLRERQLDHDPEQLTDQDAQSSSSSRGWKVKLAASMGAVAAGSLLLWERHSTAAGLAAANPTGFVQLQSLDTAVLGRNPTGEELTVQNWGANCWEPCGSVSGDCPKFCGQGNACCRFGSHKDPPECWGIWSWGSYTTHTCVKPVNPTAVKHTYQSCWDGVGKTTGCSKPGWCDFCGEGNACCRGGWGSDPAECHSVLAFSIYGQHTCVKPTVEKLPSKASDIVVPAVAPVPQVGACDPGKVKSQSTGECETATGPEKMTFYMYRAQNSDSYKQENVNMASLTGELWYLHNEVVFTCPRKFALTRLVRYVITMKNPMNLWKAPLHFQFGQFVQFDAGQCTWNNTWCQDMWSNLGYAVGCQPLDTTSPLLPYYEGPPAPVWYSLPGRCPSKAFQDKTPECLNSEPGGQCEDPDGSFDCTWNVKAAGELTLDELSGIENYTQFCLDGKSEYDKFLDKGNGTTFWDNRRSPIASAQRIQKITHLFKQKYPAYPESLPDPPCDYWR